MQSAELTTLIAFATLIALCHIRWHIHRFGKLGHGYLWKAVILSTTVIYLQLPSTCTQMTPNFMLRISGLDYTSKL